MTHERFFRAQKRIVSREFAEPSAIGTIVTKLEERYLVVVH